MIDFTRFEILTFDCYGTLINWEDGILTCLHQLLSAHQKNVEDATLLRFYGDFEARAEQGAYRPYREVLQSVVQQFGDEFDFTPNPGELSSLSESLPRWNPWPDTVAALQQLRRRFRLTIISNIDDDLFAFTRPKLQVEFDRVITAQQAQAYKPSRQIFELALRRINLPTGRILHVGQSMYHDVVPAQSLGLATVWVNRPSPRSGVGAVKAAEGTPDLQVLSMAELAALANP
jgi:2-haloacid dehalogenase